MLVCNSDPAGRPRWTKGERLDHLFEQRVDLLEQAGKKDHAAVISKNQSYSFEELDARANQLARYLIEAGIGCGDRVALLLGNSFDTYAALLAVLKTNAAYVPLDCSFPSERIGFILGDAGVKAVISLSEFTSKFEAVDLPLICLDSAAREIDEQSSGRLTADEKGPADDELAYIIYTSGTTGNPKGVAIEHGSICNFVRVAAEVYGYHEDDRVYQGMTIAFDFSVEELWVPLIVGAALVPGRSGASLVGQELHEFLHNNRIKALCCVPTLLATIEEDLPDLRLLLVSGEACPHDLVVRWHRDDRVILNAYGPTEATVTATITPLYPNKSVTIGQPLPTYTIVVLAEDEDREIPNGQSGEIAIAGIGLAKEYLNRPDLTKEKFIDDFLHLENNPSGRIYRTGDLGRITDELEIEYQGRIDTQVKIRGYRIELTEIESIILQMPQVAQAAVDVYEMAPGQKELVAYYALKSGADQLDHEELVALLRSRLPAYMVPSYFEKLDVIPMTPSHKTDRKKLPAPTQPRHFSSSQDYIEPKKPMEKAIAKALGDTLNIEKISLRDNFFTDLGAHSLLMAQFCASVRQSLPDYEISMRDVYQNQTVEELVRHMEFAGKSEELSIDEVPPHTPLRWQYLTCGALQFSTYLLMGVLTLWLLIAGFHWTYAVADSGAVLYVRIIAYMSALFVGWSIVSIAAKWLLVGRWKPEIIPIWSLRYFRFWLARYFIRLSPLNLFMGTPLYNLYLRLLGADIGKNTVILSPAPVCTDLFQVGDNTLIRKGALMPGYLARGNNIHTGSIRIGDQAFVGSASVIEHDTKMGNDSQLGHSSTLHEGGVIGDGKRVHGTPAQETDTDYCRFDGAHCSTLRRWLYPLGLFLFSMLVTPLPVVIAYTVFSFGYNSLDLAQLPYDNPISVFMEVAPMTLLVTGALFIAAIFVSLIGVYILPRILNGFLKPGKTYPLFGFHYYIQNLITGLSNLVALNTLFGDSSYIVYYLKWVGYKLENFIQTGSNFGLEQQHDNPFLCEIGTGTMVSDGLIMMNVDMTNSSFRLGEVELGEHNYLGNTISYPVGGRTGNNVLLATKVMIPVDGPVYENTGLLGSPCFEIPRVSQRDEELVNAISDEERKELLKHKNHYNIITMITFLLTNWFFGSLIALIGLLSLLYYPTYGIASLLLFGYIVTPVSIGYWSFVEMVSLEFKSLESRTVSMYNPYFLFHERHWKFTTHPLQKLFPGTPFKGTILRAMGIKVGSMLFDDGALITDHTLMEIGDHANFNMNSSLQGHSLEEGVFKSENVKIGKGCSVGIAGFVHYGVKMKDHSVLDSNAFLMKGETLQEDERWRGNPAQFVGHTHSNARSDETEPCLVSSS